MKIGNYTWKVAQNTEASKPKIQFCTDLPMDVLASLMPADSVTSTTKICRASLNR